MAEVKITAEEFSRYVGLQESGLTNMFNINFVMRHTGLTKEKVFYIMNHYSELSDKFHK